jgi:hypothetical protein
MTDDIVSMNDGTPREAVGLMTKTIDVMIPGGIRAGGIVTEEGMVVGAKGGERAGGSRRRTNSLVATTVIQGVNQDARWSFRGSSAASFTPCVVLVLSIVFHVDMICLYHHASVPLRLHCHVD